jgi:hypothetical protein
MTIRDAQFGDLETVAEIYNHAVLNTTAIFNDATVDAAKCGTRSHACRPHKRKRMAALSSAALNFTVPRQHFQKAGLSLRKSGIGGSYPFKRNQGISGSSKNRDRYADLTLPRQTTKGRSGSISGSYRRIISSRILF